ncbi:LamG domain-containing protein [Streptomyces sp. NPDC047453]|uniref:LamG domain-containing protein n=1 Tax=Streptomyces sp. NPDC047453 TaxID=3154812 RepID=UPI0033F18D9C
MLSASLAVAGLSSFAVGGAVAAHAASASGLVAPVVSYTFDSDSGTTTTDSSGNGNNGTWHGTPAYAPGLSGQAAHVSAGHQITLPRIAGKTDASGSFSYDFWIKQNSYTGDAYLFANQHGGSCSDNAFATYNASGSNGSLLGCFGTQGVHVTLGNAPTVGAWHHVAAVVDRAASTAKWYVDGKHSGATTTVATGDNLDSGLPFAIGQNGALNYASQTDALFDNVNFYDQAISAAQVQADYQAGLPGGDPLNLPDALSTSLHYYLPFDGNANSTTGAATTANDVSYVQGKFGQAAHFNSTNSWVRLDDLSSYPANYSFTMATWVRSTQTGSDPSIFGNKDWNSGSNPGFVFSTRTSNIVLNINAGGVGRVDYTTAKPITDGTWHQVAFTVDRAAGTVTLYIDGVQSGSGSIAKFAGQPFTALSTMIGNEGTGHYNIGNVLDIDEFFLFDRALYPAEVKDLYLGSPGVQHAPTITIKDTSIGSAGVYSSVDFALHASTLVDKFSINGVMTDVNNVVDYDLNGVKPGVLGSVEGTNELKLYTAAGEIVPLTFKLDGTPPTISLNDNPGMNVGFDGTYQAVSFVMRDAGGVGQVSVNGFPVVLPSAPVVGLSHIRPGSYHAVLGDNTITVTDIAGNVTTRHFTLTDAPIVAFAAPTAGAVLSGTTQVAAEVAGANLKSYQLRLDGKGLVNTVKPANGELDDNLDTTKVKNGAHTLSATVTDSLGHVTTASVAVTVAN